MKTIYSILIGILLGILLLGSILFISIKSFDSIQKDNARELTFFCYNFSLNYIGYPIGKDILYNIVNNRGSIEDNNTLRNIYDSMTNQTKNFFINTTSDCLSNQWNYKDGNFIQSIPKWTLYNNNVARPGTKLTFKETFNNLIVELINRI